LPILDIVLIALIVVVLSGLRVAQQYERGVVFRLGRYKGLRGPGLYWIIPLGIERSVRVDIRTRTVSAEQQETITRDSVTIKVNAVLWYRVTDAAKAVIEVADAPAAVYQLALTGLRNIIGQHDLDEILQERNKINTLLGDSISGSTAAWGLEVQRFEMKDVELPKAMQQVMAMQAEAIREKRARIIKAEADDFRSGRREQQHHRADDSIGFRFPGTYPERLSCAATAGKAGGETLRKINWVANNSDPAAAH
jgi:regulator of protease activity HflC (stomatin/prohibitin superfamily)